MSRQKITRQLIQFSHYSTALVLPKQLLALLDWQPGDSVEVSLNPSREQLLITKTQNHHEIMPPQEYLIDDRPNDCLQSEVPLPTNLEEKVESTINQTVSDQESPPDNPSHEILPIPEL